jgi:hypothetical protein
MKKNRWHIKDLIDLEYLLQRDEMEGEESGYHSLAKRDRDIYLKHIQPLAERGSALTPGTMIRSWLEQRRGLDQPETGSTTLFPGEAYEEIHRLLTYGLTVTGLMIGAGLAFSFLSYKGTAPVNVSTYLGGFIFLQLLLLLLLLGGSLLRKLRRSPLRSSVITTLLVRFMTSLMERLKQGVFKSIGGSEMDGFAGVKGLLMGKRQVYGALFYWPVFILAQLFGVAFNVGVLGATLLKVFGSDIAFGWQSTLQFSAEAVSDMVQAIAVPWSWFVPVEVAYPSLSQIQGSHMVLKDGIYHLTTTDLISWWPFLCLAVLFYGLLPRLILLMMGNFFQRRRLDRIAFDHVPCDRLLHRMRTPLVSTEGRYGKSKRPRPDEKGEDREASESSLPKPETSLGDRDLVALVPDEIFDDCPDEELRRIISRSLGYPIRRKLRFGEDEEGDQRVINEILNLKQENVPTHILILQEAWQPPIREGLHFIRDLRKALGKTSIIKVALIGRPNPDSIFTHVKEEDWKAWKQKLKVMGDPYLGLERLVVHDA